MKTVHVVVIGCGRIGSSLAVALTDAGHSVAVLDREKAAFKRLPKSWPGKTVAGWAFDRDDLERADIESAGAVAAVTSGDNSNILAARIAREGYGIERVVARIYDPRRAEIFARLGIPIVGTVRWGTDQVLRRLFPDESAVNWTDGTGTCHLVERAVPDAAVGRRIDSLELAEQIKIVAVQRAGHVTFGSADALLQAGDRLLLLVLGTTGESDAILDQAFHPREGAH